VVSAAAKAISERDANFRNARAQLQRLAEAEALLAIHATPPDPRGFRIFSRVLEGTPSEYLGFFATEFAKTDKAVVLLAADDGSLLFAQHPSAGHDMARLIKQGFEKLGGKGGGTREFARGKLADPSQSSAALAHAMEVLNDRKNLAS
jgi:alanyl-tRNA synthetase